MNNSIEKIETLVEDYHIEEALELVDSLLIKNPNNIQLLLIKGKIMSKKQEYNIALRTYISVLEIENDNKEALSSIELINNILRIRRTFFFENAYTDDDLYM